MIKFIAFFSYPVMDMACARKFYEETLGLTVGMNFQDQWVEYEVAGQTFAITTMDTGHQAGLKGGTVAFEVDDFEKSVAQLKEKKTSFVLENYATPVCHFAIVTDPDGNEIMIHKRKG
jgi:predicted enzyme related to lactoylglutathione lyase